MNNKRSVAFLLALVMIFSSLPFWRGDVYASVLPNEDSIIANESKGELLETNDTFIPEPLIETGESLVDDESVELFENNSEMYEETPGTSVIETPLLEPDKIASFDPETFYLVVGQRFPWVLHPMGTIEKKEGIPSNLEMKEIYKIDDTTYYYMKGKKAGSATIYSKFYGVNTWVRYVILDINKIHPQFCEVEHAKSTLFKEIEKYYFYGDYYENYDSLAYNEYDGLEPTLFKVKDLSTQRVYYIGENYDNYYDEPEYELANEKLIPKVGNYEVTAIFPNIELDRKNNSTYSVAGIEGSPMTLKINSVGGGTERVTVKSGGSSTQTCNVTFMSDGAVYTTQQVTKGERVQRPTDPQKSNCSFIGWYTNDSFTTLYDFSKAVNSNLTLYARWSRNGIVTGRNATIVAKQGIDLKEKCFPNVYENIVRYLVDDTKVASASGRMLNGKTPGTVRVEAQIKNGKVYETVATCNVKVLSKPVLALPKTMTYEGQTITASYYFTTSDTNTVGATYWESSNPSVVEVTDSATGRLLAHKSGSASISAYFGEKGKSGTLKVSATIKVKTPAFQKSEYNILTGEKLVLAMKDVDRNQSPTWNVERMEGSHFTAISASPQIDNRGRNTGKVVVNGLYCGDAKLTATIDGHQYSCVIHVAVPKLNKYNITIKKGKTATISLQNTKFKKSQISWYSNNESVAKVDANGKITGVSSGEALIYTATGGWWNECVVKVQ